MSTLGDGSRAATKTLWWVMCSAIRLRFRAGQVAAPNYRFYVNKIRGRGSRVCACHLKFRLGRWLLGGAWRSLARRLTASTGGASGTSGQSILRCSTTSLRCSM